MFPLDLPFAVLQVTLRAQDEVHLPPFPGSKLEGAFGRALYALACTQTQRETCSGCPLQTLCPYGLTYAPTLPPGVHAASLGTPPRPVIFRVAYTEERRLFPGDVLSFGMVVVGRAAAQLPYLLAALRDVGREGLGRTRGHLEMEEVQSIHPYTGRRVTLLRGDDLSMRLEPVVLGSTDLPGLGSGHVRLHLRSPLHLRVDGRMGRALHFPVLLRALQRRMSNLEQVHGGQLSLGADYSTLPWLARKIDTVQQDTWIVSQQRKGHAHHHPTSMEGLVGTVDYAGDLTPFAPLLRYGEQLGVGKWAHFGAGLYDLEISP